MVDQEVDFRGLNVYPTPILATFSKISGRPKDIGKIHFVYYGPDIQLAVS